MSAYNIYCVYLTTYSGNKLPPFYIGSTTQHKIIKGYAGSVSSKRYSIVWKSELSDNRHLFKTRVLKCFSSRKESLLYEEKLQRQLDVVNNPLYCNQAFANKGFAIPMYGKLNPMYGKVVEGCRERMKTNNPMKNPEVAKKVSESKKGIPSKNKGKKIPKLSMCKIGEKNPMKKKENVEKMQKTNLEKYGGLNPTKGTRWMTNPITQQRKRVRPEDTDEHSKTGWVFGK